MRITGAHENVVLELDGRPAFECLREIAPDGALDDLDRAVDFLFVARVPEAVGEPRGDEYQVRNILTLDPDTGYVGVGETFDEGQRIVFAVREADAARDDLARMVRRLAADRGAVQYRFGMYFDCVARGEALYGAPGVDARAIGEAFPDLPVLGFHCNAELAPAGGVNRLFTYSGVLVLVGDRAPDGGG
jgi:small ligand-binding sensory domain FIST